MRLKSHLPLIGSSSTTKDGIKLNSPQSCKGEPYQIHILDRLMSILYHINIRAEIIKENDDRIFTHIIPYNY